MYGLTRKLNATIKEVVTDMANSGYSVVKKSISVSPHEGYFSLEFEYDKIGEKSKYPMVGFSDLRIEDEKFIIEGIYDENLNIIAKYW